MKGILGFLLSFTIHYFLFDCAQSSFQGVTFASGFHQSEESLDTSDVSSLETVSLELASLHIETLRLKENEQLQEEPETKFESKPVESPDLSEKPLPDIDEEVIQAPKLDEELSQEQEQELSLEQNNNGHEEPGFEVKELQESVPNPKISHQKAKESVALPEKKTEKRPEVRLEPRDKTRERNIEEMASSPDQSRSSSKGSASTKQSDSEGPLEAPEILIRGKLVYPRVAKQRGWQGRVVIEFSIDPERVASDFRFLKKTPYDLLNREAVRSLKSYRFGEVPASSERHSRRYPMSFEFRLD